MTADLEELARFMRYVDTSSECWAWTGARNAEGYPYIRRGYRTLRAHRVAFELFIGPIPVGLELDHTCHNPDESCPGGPACLHRSCVNPLHLEAVTRQVNTSRASARITHCPQGHAYDDVNTLIKGGKSGNRRCCRACMRAERRARYARLRQRQAAA